MQQLVKQTTPFSDQELCATLNYQANNPFPIPLYVIDHPDTKLHDDAVGWLDTGDGYRVFTAITAAGLKTRFITKQLPNKYVLQLKKEHKEQASLGGRNQAIILSYWTNGESIQDPQLSFAEIHSRRYTHQTLPDKLKDELNNITNQPRSEASIEVLMSNYNTILAHTAAKIGVSVPYHDKANKKARFSAEPITHKHLGTIYTRSTSPLRSELDLITNLQVTKLLSGKGTPRSRRTIQQFLDYHQKRVQQSQAA